MFNPITEATIRAARYGYEVLPATYTFDTPASSESEALIDLRRFNNKWVVLNNIHPNISTAEFRIRADNFRQENQYEGAALPSYATGLDATYLAQSTIRLSVYNNGGAPVTASSVWHNMVIFNPTVAHKLRWNVRLNDEEQRIANQLGLADSVDKGILPLPFSYMTDREYAVMNRTYYARSITSSSGEQTVLNLFAERDTVLVLEGIASDSGVTANTIYAKVSRDGDNDYSVFPVYPLSITTEIPCFIPAMNELKVVLSTPVSLTGHKIRLKVSRIKLTNLLRVRFGLAGRGDVLGDLYDKIKGGVL